MIIIASGNIGNTGAGWELDDLGNVIVEGGFVNWDSTNSSPWQNFRTQIKKITFSDDIDCGLTLTRLFYDLPNLITIEGLEKFDTSNTLKMDFMFFKNSKLKDLDLSDWITSSLIDVTSMFEECSVLQNLNISTWDTSSLLNTGGMFRNSPSLTYIDLSNWNVSKVVDMKFMFYNASSLQFLDVSKWDVQSVETFSNTFYGAKNLKNLDVTDWNTKSVTDLSSMFRGASSLTNLDLSNWDVSKVEKTWHMFRDMSNLVNLNISGWKIRNVTTMVQMFSNANKLESLDFSDWDTCRVSDMTNMLEKCSSLKKLIIGKYFNFKTNICLPNLIQNNIYTGLWRNIGPGIETFPLGTHIFTSQQLINNYKGVSMSDIYVWDRINPDVQSLQPVRVGKMTPIAETFNSNQIYRQIWKVPFFQSEFSFELTTPKYINQLVRIAGEYVEWCDDINENKYIIFGTCAESDTKISVTRKHGKIILSYHSNQTPSSFSYIFIDLVID